MGNQFPFFYTICKYTYIQWAHINFFDIYLGYILRLGNSEISFFELLPKPYIYFLAHGFIFVQLSDLNSQVLSALLISLFRNVSLKGALDTLALCCIKLEIISNGFCHILRPLNYDSFVKTVFSSVKVYGFDFDKMLWVSVMYNLHNIF